MSLDRCHERFAVGLATERWTGDLAWHVAVTSSVVPRRAEAGTTDAGDWGEDDRARRLPPVSKVLPDGRELLAFDR